MIEKHHEYAFKAEEVFEEILDKKCYKLNHVVIKPGHMFPKHPTEADVTIVVVEGILTLKLAEQTPVHYSKGSVIEVPKGVPSELGNSSEERTEVFVIKS